MRALYSAATGMMAQEKNVEVIANNIANMRTSGFKKQRVNFQDLYYQSYRRAGSISSEDGTLVPAGLEIGSGVRTVATPRIMSQGAILNTEKETDVAIRGRGFFQVQLPDGEIGYSRDGSFEISNDGTLVTIEGYIIDPGIVIPENARDVSINAQGLVQVTLPGQVQPQNIGQIELARFVNEAGLAFRGDNLYLETEASGAPLVDLPGAEGFGTLLQRHLEQANVNAVTEISDLITAQRAYEMNSRVISAADQMLEATVSLR